MGTSYSINGYLNAIVQRSNKTILVEGPTDKRMLLRLAVMKKPLSTPVYIDHAAMIDDGQLSGLGNKSRIQYIQSAAGALTPAASIQVTEKLATLLDREWDGIHFDNCCPSPWTAPVQDTGRYITVGHSIENYCFDMDLVLQYLQHSFPEHYNEPFAEVINARWLGLLMLVAITSQVAHAHNVISKCNGIFRFEHLNFSGERCYMDASFEQVCANRKMACPDTILREINEGIDAAWARLSVVPYLKWLPHGHIGNELLWIALGKIALSVGVNTAVAGEIAFGRRDEFGRFQASWLCGRPPEDRVPLDDSVDWILS